MPAAPRDAAPLVRILPRRPPFNTRPNIGVYLPVTQKSRFEKPDDGELVTRAREGDSEALECLVARHHAVVYRFLVAFLKDEDLAADGTQETFLKALSRLQGFRGDSAFRTWLLAIARNEALGMIRSRGRRREEWVEDMDRIEIEGNLPDQQVLRSDEVQRIRKALERLPEKQRLSVSLRLFDGMSFREVGEAIGSSEGSARVNYHYGISRLREWLHDTE